jgi:hypothetical protein
MIGLRVSLPILPRGPVLAGFEEGNGYLASEPCGQEFDPISHLFRRNTADQPHESPKLFAG